MNFIVTLLRRILEQISPDIRALIISTVKDLYASARETENPYDDIAVECLAWLLDVDLK